MPKGDRDNLKADCEDGFTRIANLILEALALAKLNGTQKGICFFIFRRTYGWNGVKTLFLWPNLRRLVVPLSPISPANFRI